MILIPKISNRSPVLFMIIMGSLTFQYCSTSSKVKEAKPVVPRVSYKNDLKPIMLNNCTPCHFPEKGKVKFLDTYGATRGTIDEILRRVQLPEHTKEFMPFKSKKPPLTAAEIDLFKKWKAEGFHK